MERIIMYIDVNNAFLSWSAIDLLNKGFKEDIRNTYAVIGGDEAKRKGIVLAKSNLCKKLGIKTADTLYSARSKCKALRIYPPNYTFYSKMSNKLFQLLSFYSPDIEVASIDECYLDYGKVKKLYGDPYCFAVMIQKRINQELGFTVNIGIANNKLCAKMASDFSKPNKIHTLYDNEVLEKMYPLPVGNLFGIGKQTTQKLNELGIKTIKDLAEFNPTILKKYFKNMALVMQDSARGINNDPVVSEGYEPKGISNEITLEKDTNNKEVLLEYILNLCEMVAIRLRKEKKFVSTVAIIIKTNNFKRKMHQKKLVNPTNITREIYEAAKEVFLEMDLEEKVRLIGVRLDNLVESRVIQTSLFKDIEMVEADSKLDQVIDELKEKYGYKIINKASNINKTISNKIKNQ